MRNDATRRTMTWAPLALAALMVGCGDPEVKPTPDALTLALEAPAEGAEVSELPLEVGINVSPTGRTADLAIELDGAVIASEASASSLRATITELAAGAHTLRATATDADGEVVTAERHFTLVAGPDTEAPVIAHEAPRDDLAVFARKVRVSGRATDNSGAVEVSLSVNGEEAFPVEVDAEGHYTVDFVPTPGTNTLSVTARDAADNQTEHTSSVYFGHRISGGNSQSIALLDGVVHTWGRNELGQLGDGTLTNALKYESAKYRHEELQGIVSVLTRSTFMLALHEDGRVFSWGSNASGQLGYATPSDCGSGGTSPCNKVPQAIPGIEGAIAIAAGFDFSLVLLEDGSVLSFGENADGQLGDGVSDADRQEPAAVVGLENVIQLAAGSKHALALTADGQVYAWGNNQYGQNGSGTSDTNPHPTPQLVPELSGAVAIASGNYTPLVLLEDGSVVAWGQNHNGQVGNGDVDDQTALRPTPVLTRAAGEISAAEQLSGVVAIAGDGFVSLAIHASGRVHAWGSNSLGQLGLGLNEAGDRDLINRRVATLVPVAEADLATLEVVEIEVASGGAALVRTYQESVYAWGWSFQGSLGVPDLINAWAYTSPQLVYLAE